MRDVMLLLLLLLLLLLMLLLLLLLMLLLTDTELCTMRDKDGDQTFAKPLGKNHPCWNQTPHNPCGADFAKRVNLAKQGKGQGRWCKKDIVCKIDDE